MRFSKSKMAFWCWSFCSHLKTAVAILPSHPGEPKHRRLDDAEVVDVRHGILFQANGCPQAITSAQAQDIAANETFTGNTITLRSQSGGRTGNHFENMSQFFSMAYCCRSRLLELPGKDDNMPVEGEGAWTSTHRWYDFSDAKMDLLPEFAGLYGRPDVCIPRRVSAGQSSYNNIGVHPDLLDCLNHVFVRGCEAAFLGSVVDTAAFCRPKGNHAATIAPDGNKHRRLRTRETETHGLQSPAPLDRGRRASVTGSSQTGGSLVIHIRSGDIFNQQRFGRMLRVFGQPPLKFYLDVISTKAWTDVTIVTYSSHDELTNPTFTALGLLNDSGMLGPNVVLHHDRALVEDLRDMLCADALVVARSSLHFITYAHAKATTFYLPSSCGPGRYKRHEVVEGDGSPKKCPDNSTLLVVERPESEVYGIEWETTRDA